MKKLMSVLGLSLALAVGSGAYAGERFHDGMSMERGERMMQHMFSRLDLSDEQRDAVHAIRDEAHATMDAYKEKSQVDPAQMRAQMKALVQAESFDEQAFRDLMSQQQVHKTQMALIHAKMKNAVWNVLNAEQQAQMSEMMEKRGKRGFGRGRHAHQWSNE